MVNKLLLTLFLFIPTVCFGEYKLPNVIPHPTFGVTETVANVYGDSNYYTHWIDSTHPGCVTVGNGTPSAPRCTIPDVSNLPAGSVVQLRGGPYSSTAISVLGGIGTVSQPIFFRGDSPTNKTALARHFRVQKAAYLIIENISFSQTIAQPQIDLRTRTATPTDYLAYVSVRNTEASGTGTATSGTAYSGGTSDSTPSHDIVFLSNKVHDYGVVESPTQNDTHCLGVGTNHYNSWYLNNELYRCSGDGIGNGHDADHLTYNLYMDGNLLYGNRENGIDIKEVHNVIISNNIMHSYVVRDSDPGAALVVHYGPTTGQGPYNVWCINNLLYDAVYGIALSANRDDIYIIGNVIYDTSNSAIDNRVTSDGGQYSMYHNTLVGTGGGIIMGGDYDRLNLGGNLIASIITNEHLYLGSSYTRSIANITNELYWQSGSNVNIGWGSTYTSVPAWISASGKGTASLQADPLFVDVAGGNYKLQHESSAINSGFDMSVINETFKAFFGPNVSLLKDITGTTRPNGVWSIGAYEWASSGKKYRGISIRATVNN